MCRSSGNGALFFAIQRIEVVIIHFWVTPKFIFLFLKKKKTARCRFERHCAVLLPCKCRDRGEEDFWNIFFPLSLSTPLAQKTRMTHTHTDTYTTIPCNSHTTMPCTWTGYGEPLPRLPINTGERTEPGGRGTIFLRKRGTNWGGKILEKEGKKQQPLGGKKRRNRKRAEQRREDFECREERKPKQKWGREEQRLVVSARRRRRTVPHHLGTTAVLPLHRHNITAIQLPTTAATSSNRGETETKQRRRKNKKTEQNREVELKKKNRGE